MTNLAADAPAFSTRSKSPLIIPNTQRSFSVTSSRTMALSGPSAAEKAAEKRLQDIHEDEMAERQVRRDRNAEDRRLEREHTAALRRLAIEDAILKNTAAKQAADELH